MQVIQTVPLTTAPLSGSATYTYNTQKNRLLTAGSTIFSYDDEGQLAGKGSDIFTFDYEHRLSTINSTAYQFSYDNKGNRLKAVRNSVTTYYIYDMSGNLLAEADGNKTITRYYIYGAGQGLLAAVTPENLVYTYHFNAIGSTMAITDSSQNIVNAYAYDSFGSVLNQTETFLQPFKYVGQYGVMQETNGFYYMRARYYDPGVGRFISEDPIGFDGGDVNFYEYAADNPVNYIDPSGLDVNICYYSDAAMGFGHVGFGDPNDPTTLGFYPTGNPFDSPGKVKQDTQKDNQCKVVEAPSDKDRCMQRCRERRQKTPGRYKLTTRQCTSFVRDCLKECGLPSGDYSGPFPYPFFKGLK